MPDSEPSTRESPYWPPTALALRVDDLTMRPLVEAELDLVADLLPAEMEMNPATPRPFGVDERHARGAALRQEYWQHVAGWSPDAWELDFGAWLDGEFVGTQSLEAHDFRVLRTVDTASWLRVEFRGRGLGKLMRSAVLSLAFDGLGAKVALTEAWHDNMASLGVSRSLGYRANGSVRHRRGTAADEMPHLRMDLADWRAVTRPKVTIDGLEPCLPWLVANPSVGSAAQRDESP